MLIYILKFSACLTIFMVFYKLVLEKLSIHSFKRIYLLATLVLALIIPSITFTEYIEPIVSNFETFEPIASFETPEIYVEDTSIDYTPIILWSIYGLGVIIFLLKFSYNLHKIIYRIKNNPRYKSESFINVLVTNLMIPHTFFSYIFLNKYKFENQEIPREVLLHEQTHAKQKHSIDILIIEFLQIIFWFNPLIYLLKYDVKLNHEFLADRAVLNNGIQPSAYQNIILAFSSKASDQQLANAINYSSIKKRFTVMKTKTSKQSVWFKSLLILPILAILLYSFTEREQVVKQNSDTATLLNYNSEGVSEALMKEYNDFIIDFNTTQKINFSRYERCVSIYNLMSEEQKASVEPYPKVPTFDRSKTKAITPTTKQFELWKNEKEYAIWLDGVKIPNARLNSYSVDDIAHYVNSFVHKNARSEKFPQPNQLSLYTKEGFKSSYQDHRVNEYKSVTKAYSEAIQLYLKGEQTNYSELLILKDRALRLYESFSKEELKRYKLNPPPPPPAKKSFQKSATKAQLAEYNRLAKKYNTQSKEKQIIKLQEVKTLKRIYKIMSMKQKAEAQPFPSFPPPPPPPPPPPVHKGKVSESLLNTYNTWLKGLKNADGTYNSITAAEQKYYMSIYDHMTPEQKKRSVGIPPPPPPPAPPTPQEKKGNGPNSEGYSNDMVYRVKQEPTVKILLNTKGQFLVNDETGDLKDIEEHFKLLSEDRKRAKTVNFNYDKDASIIKIKKVFNLINLYDLEVMVNGDNIPPPPPPPIPENATPTQKKKMQAVREQYLKTHSEKVLKTSSDKQDIPPPPPPKSPLDHIIDMAKQGAVFYFNEEKISSDKAIEILKNDKSIHIQTIKDDTNTPTILLSKKPTINNKVGLKKPTPGTIVSHIKVMNRHHARFYLDNKEITFKEALAYVKKHRDADVITSEESKVVKISSKTPKIDSPLVFVIAMSKKNAKFYYKDKEITSEKAISIVKRKGGLIKIDAENIKSKQPSVFITEKGALVGVKATDELTVMINGKTPVNGQLTLSKSEFSNLKLTMKKLKVQSFKFKVPGKRTESISGNALNDKSKSYIKDITEGISVQFFDIKSTNGLKLKPIVVLIKK